MNTTIRCTTSALLAILLAAPATADDTLSAQALHDTLATLDTEVFEAFNRCDEPGQLARHGSHFAEDVEFYHDTGGVTWTREAMLANTEKFVCGNFHRMLVPGTLQVYPVKDFGAISRGTHRFCQVADGHCEGEADFTIVWRLRDGKWEITRVLSFGHRAVQYAD